MKAASELYSERLRGPAQRCHVCESRGRYAAGPKYNRGLYRIKSV